MLPVLTLLGALLVLSASSRAGGVGGPWRGLFMEAAGPVERLVAVTVSAVGDFWRGYFQLVDLRKENRELRKILDDQARQIVELNEDRLSVARLNSLLGLREAYPHLLMKPARILAWNLGPWTRSVTINLGDRDGLVRDQAVIHPLGVVGRVMETSPHYARVLLATDFSSSIDAFVQRSRAPGILSGEGGARMTLKYVRKDEEVRPGDQVVTSGLDGFFPGGLALGTVGRVSRQGPGLFMEVEVRAQAPFDRLEEVLVLVNQGPPIDWLNLAPALRPLLEDALDEERAR
ncbi:MAG: rod shape-determining protein MreC [Candidatus Adiutrix sp.]|jgi:rod shape-determining protein MreC|nr:rod shape-determining protein MreC [Candidatus Adiutrix sp.]